MLTQFEKAGIRYSLLAAPMGLREQEAKASEIKADTRLWTQAQKRRAGIGMRHDGGKNWRNRHGRGVKADSIEEAEVAARAKLDRKWVQVAPPQAIDFTDRPEYR